MAHILIKMACNKLNAYITHDADVLHRVHNQHGAHIHHAARTHRPAYIQDAAHIQHDTHIYPVMIKITFRYKSFILIKFQIWQSQGFCA